MIIVDIFETTNNPKTKDQMDAIKLNYEIRPLTKGGDYLIEGEMAKVVIERKEINDLFSSNHEGRLPKQMNKLVTEYPDYKKILLIEGSISTVISRAGARSGVKKGGVVDFSNNSKNLYARYSSEFVGIVNSIITTSDINVIQVSSKWQTITLLKNLDAWVSGEKHTRMRSSVAKKVDRPLDREVEDLWLTIHGVGWQRVWKIVNEYPSLLDLAKDIIESKDSTIKEKLGESLGSHIIEVFKNKIDNSKKEVEENETKKAKKERKPRSKPSSSSK
jgi:ERCC4-type nuclease